MSPQTPEIQSTPDASVYRPSGFWRTTLLLLGTAICVGSVFGAFSTSNGSIRGTSSILLLMSLCAVFALLGAYSALYAIRSRVVLYPDRISIQDVLGDPKVISRHQISGWRILPTTPSCLVLQTSDPNARKIKISLTFPLDDELERWFDSLQNLDVEDQFASEAEIRDSQEFGETPEQRSDALESGRSLSKALTITSFVLCGWGWFYPHPYKLVILALAVLPWVAIEVLRRSKGLFRVDQRRNDAHPTVAHPLMFPSLVLALRALLDFNVLESPRGFVLYAFIGGLLATLAARFDPTLWARKPIFAIFCAIGFAYGYGVVTEVNGLLDRSPVTDFSAVIESKHVSHGKHTSYHLKLSSWGPRHEPNDLEVGRADYDPIQCGDVAHLVVRSGALGLRWFYLESSEHTVNSNPCN